MIFVEKLIDTIIKGKDIPKVQVERYISPILEIFIAEALTKVLDENIELIAPEFPIKKQKNYQSTNIDFLLMSKDNLILVELKTDTSSSNDSQMKLYEKLIKDDNSIGEKLYQDFYSILHKSSKKDKYKTFEKIIHNKLEKMKELKNAKIVYIVPKQLANKDTFNCEDKIVITFEELYKSNDIKHKYSDEWKIITSYLKKLDDN
ncbi:MAG: hypothetical protein U9N59_12400 [Campylobacterota bacterium]|nr:hypothetical protein [Campylobacterota bacterium]